MVSTGECLKELEHEIAMVKGESFNRDKWLTDERFNWLWLVVEKYS